MATSTIPNTAGATNAPAQEPSMEDLIQLAIRESVRMQQGHTAGEDPALPEGSFRLATNGPPSVFDSDNPAAAWRYAMKHATVVSNLPNSPQPENANSPCTPSSNGDAESPMLTPANVEANSRDLPVAQCIGYVPGANPPAAEPEPVPVQVKRVIQVNPDGTVETADVSVEQPVHGFRGRCKRWWRRHKKDVQTAVVIVGIAIVIAGVCFISPVGAIFLVAAGGMAVALGEAAYASLRR